MQKLSNENYRIISSLNLSNRVTFNLNNNIFTEYMKNYITQGIRIVKSSKRLNFLSREFKILSKIIRE
ncbi:hypothetical protein CP118TE_30540 (plasmid) [Clostridium perfringens E]|uniref:Para-aminobenzoate synthase component I n=1 Tax=Clostridium perfringens TaxID=1502 RepID=F7J097_CLOPF|nr:para-aminobenzoate synthase component I [Clostridium perfringens]BDC03345.1 hypothetical protein CP118TE_30540 [Clostridium perfringens E]